VIKLVRAGAVLFFFLVTALTALYQAQNILLWKRVTPDYVHGVLRGYQKGGTHASDVGVYGYLLYFDHESPLSTRLEIVFNTSDRLESLVVRLKTFEPLFLEQASRDGRLSRFPLEELERATAGAFEEGVVLQKVLSEKPTSIRALAHSASGVPQEIEFVRESFGWKVAR
jgi:hypothetical protein